MNATIREIATAGPFHWHYDGAEQASSLRECGVYTPDGVTVAVFKAVQRIEAEANAERFTKAMNEHAALTTIAEAAHALLMTPGVEKFDVPHYKLAVAIRDFAAVRSGKPVAPVNYEEAVFPTQYDAEFWISQERRSDNSFHCVESVKAVAGWRVVFERRSGKAVAK